MLIYYRQIYEHTRLRMPAPNVKHTFMKCRLCAQLINHMDLTTHADMHREKGHIKQKPPSSTTPNKSGVATTGAKSGVQTAVAAAEAEPVSRGNAAAGDAAAAAAGDAAAAEGHVAAAAGDAAAEGRVATESSPKLIVDLAKESVPAVGGPIAKAETSAGVESALVPGKVGMSLKNSSSLTGISTSSQISTENVTTDEGLNISKSANTVHVSNESKCSTTAESSTANTGASVEIERVANIDSNENRTMAESYSTAKSSTNVKTANTNETPTKARQTAAGQPSSTKYSSQVQKFKRVNHMFVADKVASIAEDKRMLTCELCHPAVSLLEFEAYTQHLARPSHMKNVFIWLLTSEAETIGQYKVLVGKIKASKKTLGLFCEFCRKASFNVADMTSHKSHLVSEKHRQLVQDVTASHSQWLSSLSKEPSGTRDASVATATYNVSKVKRPGGATNYQPKQKKMKKKNTLVSVNTTGEVESISKAQKVPVTSPASVLSGPTAKSGKLMKAATSGDVVKESSLANPPLIPQKESSDTKMETAVKTTSEVKVQPIVKKADCKDKHSETLRINNSTSNNGSHRMRARERSRLARRSSSWSPERGVRSPSPKILESGKLSQDAVLAIGEAILSEGSQGQCHTPAQRTKAADLQPEPAGLFNSNSYQLLAIANHSTAEELITLASTSRYQSESARRSRSPSRRRSKRSRSPRRRRSRSKASPSKSRMLSSRSKVSPPRSRRSQDRTERRSRSKSLVRNSWGRRSRSSERNRRRSDSFTRRRGSLSPGRRRQSRSPDRLHPSSDYRYPAAGPSRTFNGGARLPSPDRRQRRTRSPHPWSTNPSNNKKLKPRPLSPWSVDSLTFLVEKKWTAFYEKYYCVSVRDEILCLMLQREYLQAYKGFFVEDPHFDLSYPLLIKPEALRTMLTDRISRGSPGPNGGMSRPVELPRAVGTSPLTPYEIIEPGELIDDDRRRNLRKLKWGPFAEQPATLPPRGVHTSVAPDSRRRRPDMANAYSSTFRSRDVSASAVERPPFVPQSTVSTSARQLYSPPQRIRPPTQHHATSHQFTVDQRPATSHQPETPTDFHSFDKLKALIREKLKLQTVEDSPVPPVVDSSIEVPDLVKRALDTINKPSQAEAVVTRPVEYPTASTSTGGLVFKDPFLGFAHNVLSGILKMTGLQDDVDSGNAPPHVRTELHMEQRRMHESMVTPEGHLLIRMARMTLTNLPRLDSKFGTTHSDVVAILKNLDRDVLQLIADTPMLKQ